MESHRQLSEYQFILASGSPRRKELLAYLGQPFVVIKPEMEELSAEKDPALYTLDLSKQKLNWVRKNAPHFAKPLFIIAADTIVAHNNKIFEKPRSISEARAMLLELMGTTHQVYTGVSVMVDSKISQFYQVTEVSMNRASESLLDSYLESKESLDKSGAYGIQGKALSFISSVNGCYSNVVGFPLAEFVKRLPTFW